MHNIPGWRKYQAKLKKDALKKRLFQYSLKIFIGVFFLASISYLIAGGAKHNVPFKKEAVGNYSTENKPQNNKLLCKKDVRELLKNRDLVNLKEKSCRIVADGTEFRIDTSLDVSLQKFILKNMDRINSRYIGIVVMDPVTGKILSMAGFDKINPSGNPCTENIFPAASIFKIVTAAAAVEKCGFSADVRFNYNGKKHTLYKSQLKQKINKYTNRLTFRDSFAQSVNPVFGKLGSINLGKCTLEKYAKAFGFNREINFEIPVSSSIISLSDEPYNLAEIACGFNRKTRISPIHGAMIASMLVNHGRLVEPTIVNEVIDNRGKAIYKTNPATIGQAISPGSSKVIINLMQATIRSGTCRKTFRGYQKDPILSRLNIGGKTGTIDNKMHNMRFDWFVGFAGEKQGPEKLAISIIVAHEKYIGIRASRYARNIMKYYFKTCFAKTGEKTGKV